MAFRHIKDTDEQLRFAAIMANSIADAVIGTDTKETNYSILTWNPAAEQLYGWKLEEVVGKPVFDFIQSEMSNPERSEMMHILEERGFWQGEVIQKNRGGKIIHIHASVAIVKDEN